MWECNEIVDKLASDARNNIAREALKDKLPRLFQATKIGCFIQGRLHNNDLYKHLKESINGDFLMKFFCNKYNWDNETYHSINWEAHGYALYRYSKPTRHTIIKYIHGWLANQQRRFREGKAIDALCPLCGETESPAHMFKCHSEGMIYRRQAK